MSRCPHISVSTDTAIPQGIVGWKSATTTTAPHVEAADQRLIADRMRCGITDFTPLIYTAAPGRSHTVLISSTTLTVLVDHEAP